MIFTFLVKMTVIAFCTSSLKWDTSKKNHEIMCILKPMFDLPLKKNTSVGTLCLSKSKTL